MTKKNRATASIIIIVVILSAATIIGSILSTDNSEQYTVPNFLRNTNEHLDRRRLLASVNLSQFTDPKSIDPKYDIVATSDATTTTSDFLPLHQNIRSNCQIVYIMGVEGATHHGFIPIIEALAKNQKDENGLEYDVDSNPQSLKAGLFGWFGGGRIRQWGFKVTPEVDDPAFVQTVVRQSCPNDGRKHVLIEWASFPSGQEDDKRTYRVHRSPEWLNMSPEEIANSDEALEHPTNMNEFYQSYSPYVDIKFIVLHRPFLETIASHRDWDGGPIPHSNIIRGFMLMLRRFLDHHLYDLVTGRRLWSLVCVERIMAKNYETAHDVQVARRHVLSYLTEFLGWEDGDCPQCFDDWRESSKDPLDVLGSDVEILQNHMTFLQGVWPPPGEQGIVEQQCGV